MDRWHYQQRGIGNLVNVGVINLAGSSDKGFYNDGILDNFGTILQTGTGNLVLQSDNGVSDNIAGMEAGATYLIESNAGIGANLATAILNAGTIVKTAGSGNVHAASRWPSQ